jgi:hypothetical protein
LAFYQKLNSISPPLFGNPFKTRDLIWPKKFFGGFPHFGKKIPQKKKPPFLKFPLLGGVKKKKTPPKKGGGGENFFFLKKKKKKKKNAPPF